MKMYYDADADLGLLKGKKVAIIGFGSQGHAQALNLRDSGVDVVVSEVPGTPNYDLAVKYGFKPVSAAKAAAAAEGAKMAPDAFYCMEMLKATGIVVVPGSGFGQQDGTFHLRMTILPSEEAIDSVIEKMGAFQKAFLAKYA